jgi:6-phosphogluconolactonase (cycloisomerase 2 family)
MMRTPRATDLAGRRRWRAVVLATGVVMGTTGLLTTTASATPPHGRPSGFHAVFVQTDDPAGNQIVALDEATDGTLNRAGTFATGGDGAVQAGAVADHLASQGSLVFDRNQGLLFAVNAGSDSVSVFGVLGDDLALRQVISSGGHFPTSIAVHGDLVYVLDAANAGSVKGFAIVGRRLHPLFASVRSLGLSNADPPNFLLSPAQVGFTPDGRHLVVTTKGSGSDIDVFSVSASGRLSSTPVVNASATPSPFGFTFGPGGMLDVSEAGNSSMSTYRVEHNGTLEHLASLTDGLAAQCWNLRIGRFVYGADTGSNAISGFRIGAHGSLSFIGTGVVAQTGAGPIDMATSAVGSVLYQENGVAGSVDEFTVNRNGSLAPLGSIVGLGAGIQGLATD